MQKNKLRLIDDNSVEIAVKHIKELPIVEKPKQMTLQQAITKLTPSIKNALKLGYTYAELVPILKQYGIIISTSTLKSYTQKNSKKSIPKEKENQNYITAKEPLNEK